MDIKMKMWNISIGTHAERDVISQKLNRTGAWEPEAVQRACDDYQIHGAHGNMLDIGGNIGAFALPLADCLRKHSKDNGIVISIEANTHDSQKFRTSIKRNNLDNIHLYEYAISSPDANDTIVMTEHQENYGRTRHAPKTSEYKAPATTIDAIAKVEGDAMKRIFFLKMDLEGHEPKALQGAKEFMKKGPCLIFVTNTRAKERMEMEDEIQRLWSDAKEFDSKLFSDAILTGMMLQEWGYMPYTGAEGWFKHKNWKGCIKRML